MLDSYSSIQNKTTNSFNYNINAVGGTIRKSHPKSLITKVKLNDKLLDKLNPRYTISTPHESGNSSRSYTYYTDADYPVVVLQVMLCGDSDCLVEFVKECDFI
jgi:hypothetical protein